MVTGGEHIFENIYEARDYILSMESIALHKDIRRRSAPLYLRPIMFNVPYHCCPVKVPDDYYKV